MAPRTPVSIVLHVWNDERYVDAALTSILAQSHDDFELCILDDGSTDDTPKILQRAAADARVRIARQAHLGRDRLDETFNQVLEMASNELVAIANSDDLWFPHKLATQVDAFASEKDLDVCWHDAQLIGAEGEWLGPTLWETPMVVSRRNMHPRAFISGYPIHNPTVMFRQSIVDEIGPQEGGYAHDFHFWLKAALAKRSFLGLPERLMQYRIHEESHSTSSVRRERINREAIAMLATVIAGTPIEGFYPELSVAGDSASRAYAYLHLASIARARGITEVIPQCLEMSLELEDNTSASAALASEAAAPLRWDGDLPAIAELVGALGG